MPPRMLVVLIVLALASSCGGGDGSPASPIRLVELADGLNEPTTIAYPNDGSERLFIAERAGVIRVFDGAELLDEPFLDIQDQIVTDFTERGLVGMVFHPDYRSNGRFYVAFTRRGVFMPGEGGDVVIREYRVSRADANVADPKPTQRDIIVVEHYDNQGHNGGQLAFGPDGYLYIGIGDADIEGAPFRRAEDRELLVGKILRIGVPDDGEYTIPEDNPFADGGGRGEIWAYGLRNPWRFSFDRATGDLYIADVGELAMEEVNFQPGSSRGGENYGWPTREGIECAHPAAVSCNDPSLTPPILSFGRSDGSCAVIGGYVYRGPASIIDGVYLYTDFCAGVIRGLRRCDDWVSAELLDEGKSFTTFGEGKDARLYLADLEGALYAVEPRTDGELPADLAC